LFIIFHGYLVLYAIISRKGSKALIFETPDSGLILQPTLMAGFSVVATMTLC